MIVIDLTAQLPLVLEAKSLLQQTIGSCWYSAPCVIGAMMEPNDRIWLSGQHWDDTAIGELDANEIVEIPEGQFEDIKALQKAFDNGDWHNFERELDRLVVKWLPTDKP
jgi:hypothetical protein